MHEIDNKDKTTQKLFEKSDTLSRIYHKFDNLTKELETA
jgi:hypothetical protein